MRPLEEILNEYEELRKSFRNTTKSGSLTKTVLSNFKGDLLMSKLTLNIGE